MALRKLVLIVWVLLVWLLVLPAIPTFGQAPRSGGVLTLRQREDPPQGFAIHETSSSSTVWPAMPCFNNLVLFDPLKPLESGDTIVGELAERWSWRDNDRALVFALHKDVRWHDGKPFTSADVKFTFDLVREAPDARAKLRLSPRQQWYVNVEAVETPDPHTAVFRLKRPQPSLLLMLASGFTPIYAAHVSPATYRTGCIGTGPFKLKEWRKGEFVEYVRNPDYFVKGRPYLDGLRYVIIVERGTATAALQTGRVDVAFPGDTTKPIAERLKAAAPQLVITETGAGVVDNVILNSKRPPFDNVSMRRAVSHAIDRRALIAAVYQGGGIVGASMAPRPYGVWGLPDGDLLTLPGYGRPADEKAKARALLAQAGFGPQKPLKVEVMARGLPAFMDVAAFVINELKHVGIDASLKQVESAQWHPLKTRGDYHVGTDRAGVDPDDPDSNFYENFGCGSPRNYGQYCNEEISKLIDEQSRELNSRRRLALAHAIQKKLEEEAVRPVLAWRFDYFTRWPYVKNLVPHQSIYNWGRMQEVWRDK